MKILNMMLGTGHGGLENACFDFHEALQLAQCDVTSLLSPKAMVAEKFPPYFKKVSFFHFSQWDPTAGYRLKRIIQKYSFDVILAHGNKAIKSASSIRDIAPLIAVCHTTNYNVKKTLRQIDGAIVLTNHYRDVLLEAGYPYDKICIVPNSVRLGPEPLPHPPRDRPVIGGLGRLVPNKGFDILMQALLILKKKGVPFYCVIHGLDEKNSTQTFVKKRDAIGLTSEDVFFGGWTSDPDMFLRSIDIFCMPSRREVLSIALLQALAAGRPIICTRIPGFEDVFQNSVEGFFVDIENVDQLAHKLKLLLCDHHLRLEMGRRARKRAERFEIAQIGKELRNSLESLIKI